MLERYKLKELGDIITGNTPSTKVKEYYETKDIMFVKPADISSDITEINTTQDYISNKAIEKARLVPANTLLTVCIGATVGKIAVSNTEVTFNQQINALIPNDKIYNSKYLAYALLNNRQKLIDLANSAVVPIVNKSQFGDFEINIHEYKKQVRVVDVLDKAQELIDKRKEQIEALDELVKSNFIEMFGDPFTNDKGWQKEALKRVVTDDCTISYGIVQTGEEPKEGIPVFRPVDIVNNKKPKLEELKKTTQEISNKYKKTLLQGNELLMTVRANIGDVCVINEEFRGCNVGRGIVPIRVKEEVNPIFLQHQFKSHRIQQELKSLAKGITLIQLNMEDLREFMIIVPPREMQNKFVDFIKQVDKLKEDMEKSLKELEDNFNSLMQRAFKGELF